VGDKFLSIRTPLAPPGRGVGGEGVSAQGRVATCNKDLRNAHLNNASVSPHPNPSTYRSTPVGEGLFLPDSFS
jgi:hypothetical protein